MCGEIDEVVLVDNGDVVEEPVHAVGCVADDAHHSVEFVASVGAEGFAEKLELVDGFAETHELARVLEVDWVRGRGTGDTLEAEGGGFDFPGTIGVDEFEDVDEGFCEFVAAFWVRRE